MTYTVPDNSKEVIEPMSNKAVITAVTNQKGGTGKTTTCENLGIGLAMEGKKVLLVDCDPQASLTIALGNPRPDDLPITLSDLMAKAISDQPISPGEGILHHPEGVDLVPANSLAFLLIRCSSAQPLGPCLFSCRLLPSLTVRFSQPERQSGLVYHIGGAAFFGHFFQTAKIRILLCIGR